MKKAISVEPLCRSKRLLKSKGNQQSFGQRINDVHCAIRTISQCEIIFSNLLSRFSFKLSNLCSHYICRFQCTAFLFKCCSFENRLNFGINYNFIISVKCIPCIILLVSFASQLETSISFASPLEHSISFASQPKHSMYSLCFTI